MEVKVVFADYELRTMQRVLLDQESSTFKQEKALAPSGGLNRERLGVAAHARREEDSLQMQWNVRQRGVCCGMPALHCHTYNEQPGIPCKVHGERLIAVAHAGWGREIYSLALPWTVSQPCSLHASNTQHGNLSGYSIALFGYICLDTPRTQQALANNSAC